MATSFFSSAYESAQTAYDRTRSASQGFVTRVGTMSAAMQTSAAGRAFHRGMGEALGFGYAPKPTKLPGGRVNPFAPPRYTAQGWLGWRGTGVGEAYAKTLEAGGTRRQAMRGAMKSLGRGGFTRADIAAARRGGAELGGVLGRGMAGGAARTAGSMAMRLLGPVMIGYAMHEGYKEGGISGAIASGAKEIAIWGAFEVAITMVGGPIVIGAGIAAAAGYGYYAFGEAAQAHRKRLRDIEMGGGLIDPFGTAATGRQRGLMALQNTHINGRMAMGNEGVLMHDGAYRR